MAVGGSTVAAMWRPALVSGCGQMLARRRIVLCSRGRACSDSTRYRRARQGPRRVWGPSRAEPSGCDEAVGCARPAAKSSGERAGGSSALRRTVCPAGSVFG